MTTDMIKSAAKRAPFRPFRIRIQTREFPIQTEDDIHVHPDGRSVFVFDPQGGYSVLDVSLITDLRLD